MKFRNSTSARVQPNATPGRRGSKIYAPFPGAFPGHSHALRFPAGTDLPAPFSSGSTRGPIAGRC